LTFEQRQLQIGRWLSPPDPSTNHNKALQQRQEGTGRWFLESHEFVTWKAQKNSFLWLHGIPGCGKTILSSTIIESLKEELPGQPLLYFYFDFDDTSKQSLESIVRSLLRQIYYKHIDTQELLDALFSACDDGRGQPSCESLCKVLLQMIGRTKEVWIILDALDECNTRKGRSTEGLLSWVRELINSEQRNVHLLVTGRPEQDIQSTLGSLARKKCTISVQSDLVSDDIRAYVHTRVRNGDGLKRWRNHPDVQDEIEATLTQKANGM
jgi:Cdc6-like AAA superfamily ATPase